MVQSKILYNKINNDQFSYSTWMVLIGHWLERFDVTLFAYILPIISGAFFPATLKNATFLSLAAFAATYVARPLGAAFFGHLGDRYGRKGIFINTLLFTVLAMLIIGFLPSYEQIGLLAPLCIIVCRLLQGVSSGAEFIAGSVFVLEHQPKGHLGWLGSVITATGLGGAILAALVALWASSGSPYIWRGAFLVGAFMTGLIYWKRARMLESPIFLQLLEEKQLQKFPALKALRDHPFQVLLGVMLGGCSHMVFYTSTIYFSTILVKHFHWSMQGVTLLNVEILLGWFILSLAYGWLSQFFSLKIWLKGSLFCVSLLVIPLFYCLYTLPSEKGIPIFLLIYILAGGPFVCALPGYFRTLFPPALRLSGLGISIMLGQALFGGTFPLIATFLVDITHWPIAPSLFIAAFTSMTGFLLHYIKD